MNRSSHRWLAALGFGIAGVMTTAPVQSQELCGGVDCRRAALNQWWTPQGPNGVQVIGIGGVPKFCAADGENIWVSTSSGNIYQVQASTGKIIGPWTGVVSPAGLLTALGKVWVVDETHPAGALYVINPAKAPGAATLVVHGLGDDPTSIAFDGMAIWTANANSVSKIDPVAKTASTISTGFNGPNGILYDGANIWVTDFANETLVKLDASGAIVQTVAVGMGPYKPVFDGTNIWVPNASSNSVTVVQASTGNVVATITADTTNKLNTPLAASFDGERILITNNGGSVTLFKAADLSLIANVVTPGGAGPFDACSDGINFWITDVGSLLRF